MKVEGYWNFFFVMKGMKGTSTFFFQIYGHQTIIQTIHDR